IVSEPGHKGRRYRLRTNHEGDRYLDPETWLKETAPSDGSWWPAWAAWLAERSGRKTAPPPMGAADPARAPLTNAPGSYVLQR
ncbi:MAG: poly-beta-hydroxybutyrate polymerase, partial [Vicinamibacterales bacterium]